MPAGLGARGLVLPTWLRLVTWSASCLSPSSLQVGLWGAETGDEMGSGETYDGDGIGTNISAEENHPYAARAPRQRNFGSVHFH